MKFGGGRKLLDGSKIVIRERSGPTMRPNQSSNQFLIDLGATGSGLRKGSCAFRWIPRDSDLCDRRMSFSVLSCSVRLLKGKNDFIFAQSSVGQPAEQFGI